MTDELHAICLHILPSFLVLPLRHLGLVDVRSIGFPPCRHGEQQVTGSCRGNDKLHPLILLPFLLRFFFSLAPLICYDFFIFIVFFG